MCHGCSKMIQRSNDVVKEAGMAWHRACYEESQETVPSCEICGEPILQASSMEERWHEECYAQTAETPSEESPPPLQQQPEQQPQQQPEQQPQQQSEQSLSVEDPVIGARSRWLEKKKKHMGNHFTYSFLC